MIEVGKTDLAGLEGVYRVVEVLDDSPAGAVYLGIEREFSEQVIIKALPSEADARGELSRQFGHEAKILQSLNSPYVPRVRDWGADQGLIFIVTEHTPGKTLRRTIEEAPDGQLPAAQALDIARKIGLALDTIFARGVVHRDLKPRNVIVTRDGQVKLANFGLAAHLDLERATKGDGRTLAYLAPEQTEAARPVDIRADLYAAGAMLYEMLAGRPPFEAANNVQLLMKIVTAEPPPLYRIRPDLPLAVHRFVEKALDKKPENRFQTPREFAAAIEKIRLAEDAPAQAEPKAEASEPAILAATFVSVSTNKQYAIPKRRSLIGRRNRATGETPDIDLLDEPDGDTVSRQHAWIVCGAEPSAWLLELHGGHKNVSKVNGQRVDANQVHLNDGDEIQLGAVRLIFRTH